MKKIILSCVLLMGVGSLFAKDRQTLVVTTTPKMSCQNCPGSFFRYADML